MRVTWEKVAGGEPPCRAWRAQLTLSREGKTVSQKARQSEEDGGALLIFTGLRRKAEPEEGIEEQGGLMAGLRNHGSIPHPLHAEAQGPLHHS